MPSMKRRGKRVLSGITSAALLANFCTVMPANVFAADDAEQETKTTAGENGHRYQVFDTSMRWTEAEEYCESLGGHLVTITSEEEQKYIIDSLLPSGTKNTYFIGLFRDTSTSSWSWVTNESFDYTNWDYGEPNNTTENYVHMYCNIGNYGTWNNTLDYVSGSWSHSTSNCGFICEWEAEETPEEEPPVVVENRMKHYALFSASSTSNFGFSGWKSNINGNIYSGASFNYSGSEFYVSGRIDAVDSVNTYGWKSEIGEVNENAEAVELVDYDKVIHDDAQPYEYIEGDTAYVQDKNIINSSIKVDGNIVIGGTSFEGDCYIIAEGNITYNVHEFDTTGRVFLYSRNGNITINGTSINFNGAMYAPNGKVSFNTYETYLTGFVWADTIKYSGSIFNVDADNFDMLEPRSVVKTYTIDDDFNNGEFSGLCLDIPNQLTLSAASGEKTPYAGKVYGDIENGKGVKVSSSADRSFVSGKGDEVTVKYDLSGFGEADVNENAVDLIIVVDESGSMSGSRMSSTKAAAKQIISQMKANDRCAVVGFTTSSNVKQDLTSDKELLENAVDRLYASGGTAINSGINKALAMFEDQSEETRQKYIILLSDGEDGTNSAAAAAAAGEKGIRIFTLMIGSGTLQMQNIAINSNGIYKNAPSSDDIVKIMSYFASEVFNVAGRNTTFKTTVKNADSVDVSKIVPEPSKTVENEDGSLDIEWNFDRITVDELEEISIPMTVTDASDGFADLLENTSCVYYDRAGKPNIVYADDLSLPVSSYAEKGNWSVVFDSERETVDWENIYWDGKRYGDGTISVYVSVSDDGESFSEPVKVADHEALTDVSGRYVKLSVDMTVSSDGRSPELYDITIASKDGAISELTNAAPSVSVISKGVTKVNVPMVVRASVKDDCLSSDISVSWSCDSENVKFSGADGIITSVTCAEAGSYDIVCTVNDGEKTVTGTKTIVCEPADSYADIDPDHEDEAVAPKINVVLPKYADRKDKISTKIEKLNNTEISWYSVIFNGSQAVEVNDEGEFTLTMPNRDGTYTVVVRAFDWSGKSDVKEYSIIVDNTLPDVDIKPSSSEVSVGAEAYFKVSVSSADKVKELTYTLNGEEVTVPEDGILSVDTSEETVYTLEANGTANNGKAISASAELTVIAADTEKPVVTINFDKDKYSENQTAVFTVTATDNVGVTSLTVLVNGEEVTPDEEGRYTIADLKYGEYTVTANASDAAGNTGTVTETFTARDTTRPDMTLYVDKLTALVGDTVNIQVVASDNNGEVINTLTINDEEYALSEDGTAVFVPEEAGEYVVYAMTVDTSGNAVAASLTVNVIDPDTTDPVVTLSFDKDTYFESDDITVTVSAKDDGEIAEITLFIDGEEAELSEDGTYTISNVQLGEYEVYGVAVDAFGNIGYAAEIITVNELKAPEITVTFDKETYSQGDSLKGLVTAAGQNEIITLTATVNGQPLTIEDGIFTLSELEAKVYIFTFTAEDARGKTSTITKNITVIEPEQNFDEMLYAEIDGIVEYGKTAEYKVFASADIDKTTISVTLNGEKIDLAEDYTYEFKGEKLFDNEFVVTAKTADGDTVSFKNTVLVNEKEKPTVTVTLNKDSDIQEHDDIVVTVKAEDISGIKRILCLYDGVEMPLDENGQIFLNDFDMKPHAMIIRAWDNFGNLRAYLLSFYVTESESDGGSVISVGDGEDVDTKVLAAHIVIPAKGAAISCPTSVIGYADGTDFDKYRLEYQAAAGGDYTLITEGSRSVSGQSLGEFDPTMLKNGLYNIRLTVWGENGQVLTDEVTVSVEGQMKLGNFSIDFQDMAVQAAGIPVSLVRGYDSRDRNNIGDFGYGWNITTCNATITKSCNLSYGWDKSGGSTAVYTAKNPHYVTINWGNGQVEKFAMKVNTKGFASLSMVSIALEAMDGSGSKLTTNIDSRDWYYEDGYLFYLDSEYDEHEYDPTTFTLTRPDGSEYVIRKDRGLTQYKDSAGNTLVFASNGIQGNADPDNTIFYNRDALNRITSIETNSGKKVTYTYDDNGDLASVTDISGYETTFKYEDHYLTEIIDPRGVTVSRNIYDDNGRLIKTIDADGNEIVYDHDIDGREETIKDRNGGITRYIYDHNGNVLSVTDPMGNTVKSTYDSNGRLATKTDAMGNVTNYTYDEKGNMSSLTDAEGNTVNNSFNEQGLLTSVNAMGIDIIKVSYDSKGRTTSTEDALGNVISYDYTGSGELESITDEIGTYAKMTYDDKGNVISVTNGEGTTSYFTYDANGNCTSKTLTFTTGGVERTVIEKYSYDEAGNLVQVIDSDGNITTTDYNSMGKIASATDAKGRKTSYGYDDLGNLVSIIYADGTSESFTYDAEGNNLTATDRLGRTVTMKYDRANNLISKTYPNGAAVKYSYDKNYNLTSVIDANGNMTEYEYDKIGRNTAIIDAAGKRTEFTYNEFSQLAAMTDAKGNVYKYTYDDNGNRTSVEYPDGSSVSSAYDARGRITSQTDQNGNVTSYTYDGADRLTSVTDALGNTTAYTYNEVGNLIQVTDANGNATVYDYDDFSRVVKTTNALGNSAELTYDECGNVLTSTDFAGKLTSYEYDGYDRLISKTNDDGTTAYSYTEDGKLAAVTDSTGVTSFTYDGMDGLSKVEYPDGRYVSYTYDDTNRLTSVESPAGVTSYEYDKLDRLVKVVDRNGYATLYEYDENGNRTAVKYANGITVTYAYDEVNRLISEKALDSEGGLVAQYEYTLGAAGERTKVEELNRTVEYTYDALYRLTSETITAGEEVTEYTYEYDSVSNRISKTENGAKTEYTYNALNQLVSENDAEYTYDDAGNLVSVVSGTKTAQYTYNAANKMIRATVQEGNDVAVEEYEYDYAGNRTVKSSENDYTYYLNDINGGLTQVIAEYDKDGNEKCSYTRGIDIISQERDGNVSFYLTDGHGSVRQLADMDGAVTDTYVYDAWGNLISSTGDTENSYLYCGEQLDSTTGLYYLRARYMDPSTGTFISMDTYGGSIFDPVSLHKYLYANANPVMNSDPTGYFTLAEVSVSQAISAIQDKMESLNYVRIYHNLKSKINTINNILTVVDMARQIGMIITDPELDMWQMIEGIACGVITSMFINHMCQMKAIGPIISKVLTGVGLATQWKDIMDCAKRKDWYGVASGSVHLLFSLMSLHQNCFTGDTLVAAEDGQKRIDEIEVGDKVWAYNIFTGETELKEVLTVYVHDDETEILHLHTTAGDVDTTTNHPFYVLSRGWVAAGDLNEGDEVYLIDGSTAFVTGAELERFTEPVTVYNLEVADFNTYFVGDDGVLVHNYKKSTDNKGGAYGNVAADGGEVHHMPANSVSPFSKDAGPSIQMDKADHMKTKSWGSSASAVAYREEQAFLIENGMFKEAIMMDIDDVRSKFGDKYDSAILEMLEYVNKLFGYDMFDI